MADKETPMRWDQCDDSDNNVLKRSRELEKAKQQLLDGFYERVFDSDRGPDVGMNPVELKVYKELTTWQLRLLSSKPGNMSLSSSTSPNVAQGTPFVDPSGYNVYGFHNSDGLS